MPPLRRAKLPFGYGSLPDRPRSIYPIGNVGGVTSSRKLRSSQPDLRNGSIMTQHPNSPAGNQPSNGQQGSQQFQNYQPPYEQQPGLPPQDDPKKRNWFARHKVLTGIGIAVVGIALISSIAGGGSSDDDPVAANSDVQAQDAAAEDAVAEEAAAEDAPAEAAPAEDAGGAGIGDPVTSGDLEFIVNGVEDGGTEIGSEYLGATAQGEFFLVNISVTNTGNEAESFFGGNQKLIDSDGREHETDSSASLYIPDNDTLFTEINPGNTVVGTLVFDLPADAVPVELVVQGGLFDSDATVNLAVAAE